MAPLAHRPGISKQNRALLGVGAVVAVVVVVIAAITLSSDSQEDAARDRCKDSVLNQLATPATTKFIDDVRVTPSGLNSFEMVDANINFGGDIDEDKITEVWAVTGSFDTQNRNGAIVRGTYTCKAVFMGDALLTTVTSAEVR